MYIYIAPLNGRKKENQTVKLKPGLDLDSTNGKIARQIQAANERKAFQKGKMGWWEEGLGGGTVQKLHFTVALNVFTVPTCFNS